MIIKETDDYKVHYEEEDGYVFLHLDVYNWNKTVYRELKELHRQLLIDFWHKGYYELSFYVPRDRSLKFMKMLKPLDYHTIFGPEQEYQAGGWFTGEE